MFRFIARRLPRFRLSTLCASMIVVVSVAGAARHGGGPERREAAALQALQDEGIPFTAHQVSGARIQADSGDSRSWNPTRPLANWLVGASDRLERVGVYGWPSETTRQKLFGLSDLKRLDFEAPGVRGSSSNTKRTPTPEEILGRREAVWPGSRGPSTIADEPPPLPSGTTLSDDERSSVLRDLAESRSKRAEFPAKRFLCVTRSLDLPHQTLITAVDRDSKWRLQYDRAGQDAYAMTETRTGRVLARQSWQDDGWRTTTADQGWFDFPPLFDSAVSSSFLEVSSESFLNADPEKLYEDVERLEDGSLLLHLRPKELSPATGLATRCELTRGVMIVDPAADFAVRRIEFELTGGHLGPKSAYRQLLEYDRVDGHLVPVRRLTWTDWPTHSVRGQLRGYGPKAYATEHAWKFDPDLPPDLFEPTRGGAEFFSAERTRRFPWWYVTGTVSLCWLAVVSLRGVRSRLAPTKPLASAEGPSDLSTALRL